MNRFVKKAEANRPVRSNWFSKLDKKTQTEIIDAAKSWDGPMTILAAVIRDELKLSTSPQQIAVVISNAKKQ